VCRFHAWRESACGPSTSSPRIFSDISGLFWVEPYTIDETDPLLMNAIACVICAVLAVVRFPRVRLALLILAGQGIIWLIKFLEATIYTSKCYVRSPGFREVSCD